MFIYPESAGGGVGNAKCMIFFIIYIFLIIDIKTHDHGVK